jgi:hypothetical protein
MLVCLLLLPVSDVWGREEKIYTKGYTQSFSYKWIDTRTGEQRVEELFPNDQGAANPDGSDVIKWTWHKEKADWAGWGILWRGWDQPIDFFRLVGQTRTGISSAVAEEFSKRARNFTVQFKIKGSVTPQHEKLLKVKFDGQNDQPSEWVEFLSYLYDGANRVSLSPKTFYTVKIPLNLFYIVRNRIDASKIKDLVFSTPTAQNTDGELYLYDIKIVGPN